MPYYHVITFITTLRERNAFFAIINAVAVIIFLIYRRASWSAKPLYRYVHFCALLYLALELLTMGHLGTTKRKCSYRRA